MLTVNYKNIKINNKQYLKPNEASLKPTINYEANPNKLYTLIMHDPDAPIGNFVHWLVINIKGSDIKSGKEIIKYKGPSPPSGSGTHRYIFLIYEQLIKIKDTTITNNVIPITKLLSELGLQNNKPIYTILFTSSYEKGGKNLLKTKSKTKTKTRKYKKTRRNIKY